MEKSIGIGILFLASSLSAQPADPVEVSSRVLDRGAHHTSWETVWQTADSDAGSGLVTNRFVQLATGLNRLELDLILREALPPPETFGLDSRSVRLVVVSEFFDSITPVVLRETDIADSAGATLVDQWLGFGDMQMVPGRAFAMDAGPLASGVPVGKTWQEDGRSLLFEAVEYSRLEPLLDTTRHGSDPPPQRP